MTIFGMRRLVLMGAVLLAAITAATSADDWPAYRHDSARSGVTADDPGRDLVLRWAYTPRHAPAPAWPEPGRELNRMEFDYVSHAVIADGMAFLGSSADHKAYALDLATGEERWSFFTEGPVRFAPVVHAGRVLVASDDGFVYSLRAADGRLEWKFRAAPADDKLVGNGSVISRWPVRTGVAVEDGTVYCTAGMWPSEGVYVYALRPEDGAVLWESDAGGLMYLTQPHPPSMALTGVTPQGYLVVAGDRIFVPTGRNVPAALDRSNGAFVYYKSRPDVWGDRWGGSWNMVADGCLLGWRAHLGPDIDIRRGESEPWPNDGLVAFDAATGGRKVEVIGKLRAAVRDGTLYASGADNVGAYDWKAVLGGAKLSDAAKWESPHARAYELIVAGDSVIVGGAGTVTAFDARTGGKLWQGEVGGQARGLASAGGRVVATTTTGQIACFGPTDGGTPVARAPSEADEPVGVSQADLAQRIIEKTGVTSGLCLMLGAGDGELAAALARESRLDVICAEPDASTADAVRRRLDAAGLYGTRVTVHHVAGAVLPYAQYMANLVVSTDGLGAWGAGDVYRVIRPFGGRAYLASAGVASRVAASKAAGQLRSAGVPGEEIGRSEGAVTVSRGPLPGAADWTHQYADAGRKGSSDDRRVRAPLKLLWFGDPGPVEMVNRHWKGPAPLCAQGRMFVFGQKTVIAVDAFNGRELWRRELEAAGRFPVSVKGASGVTDGESVFVTVAGACLRLDAVTGQERMTYSPPDITTRVAGDQLKSAVWSFLAVDGDTVYGSLGDEKRGLCLFALAKGDGALRWLYMPSRSVHHGAVAIGGGRVYMLDKPTAEEVDKLKRRGGTTPPETSVVALDAASGETVWERSGGLIDRTELRLAGDVVLATGGGRATALSAGTGRPLSWSGVTMRGFPVIVGDTIYSEPYAYDLVTGDRKVREHPLTGAEIPWTYARTYGCGATAAAPGMLLFRSGALGYYDLDSDSGVGNIGGVRTGCYVNAIAADGLVLAPPGDSGCTCSYSYQTTVALAPVAAGHDWSVFSAPSVGAGERVHHLALNFGAPGDARTSDGTLWLAYPRPGGMAVPVRHEPADQLAIIHLRPDEPPIEGTDAPWLYSSAAAPTRLTIALGPGDEREYEIVLHFAEMGAAKPGDRTLSVRVQGSTVLEGLDVVKEAGGARRALVKTIRGVRAGSEVAVELSATGDGAPALCALELREAGA